MSAGSATGEEMAGRMHGQGAVDRAASRAPERDRSRERAGDRAVELLNAGGTSPVVLVCEHASNRIPPEYGDLGLPPALRESHIAWDPGALGVAQAMAEALDAPLVAARISRLVYDVNRPPSAASAIPEVSEVHRIPGNAGLTPEQRRLRIERVYEPFRRRLSRVIDERLAAGRPVVLVTVHTFTPVFHGERRDTEIGVLHDADARLADALLRVLEAESRFVVHRNRPYGPADGVTHTLAEQAIPRGLPNVMIEVRNDLVADPSAQRAMGRHLAAALSEALAALAPTGAAGADMATGKGGSLA